MSKRVIDIYFDVQKNALVDSGSSSTLKSRLRPYLIYREKPLVNLHIVDGDVAIPYTGFNGTETYICSTDDDFDHASTILTRTVDSGINVPGDWFGNEDSSGGDSSAALAADPTQGEISVQIDAETAEYGAAVGTSEKISGWMELKAYSGVELIFVLRFAITCENILDDSGSSPTSVLEPYGWQTAPATPTSTGIAGQMAYDANYFYVCTATDTWRRTAIATW